MDPYPLICNIFAGKCIFVLAQKKKKKRFVSISWNAFLLYCLSTQAIKREELAPDSCVSWRSVSADCTQRHWSASHVFHVRPVANIFKMFTTKICDCSSWKIQTSTAHKLDFHFIDEIMKEIIFWLKEKKQQQTSFEQKYFYIYILYIFLSVSSLETSADV